MSLQGHICQRWLQTAFILIIAVASMGFTRVVVYCSMSDSAVCCCMTADACDLPPLGSGQNSIRTDTDCYISETFGGLPETPGLAALESSVVSLSGISPSLLSHPIDIALVQKPVNVYGTSPDHAPPLQGDICIQVQSLLI